MFTLLRWKYSFQHVNFHKYCNKTKTKLLLLFKKIHIWKPECDRWASRSITEPMCSFRIQLCRIVTLLKLETKKQSVFFRNHNFFFNLCNFDTKSVCNWIIRRRQSCQTKSNVMLVIKKHQTLFQTSTLRSVLKVQWSLALRNNSTHRNLDRLHQTMIQLNYNNYCWNVQYERQKKRILILNTNTSNIKRSLFEIIKFNNC